MARKSRQLRLSQAQELAAQYEEHGFVGTKKHRFITDMVERLQRRDISGGQKRFLDDLISQGPPQVHNLERVAVIDAALAVDGMQHRREPLEGFARSLRGGWELSEKQENFLKILLEESEKLKIHGKYAPPVEQLEDLNIACQKIQSSGGWYLNHRPGTAKAYGKVSRWLEWKATQERNSLIAQTTGEKFEPIDEPHIDEWVVTKVLGAAKKVLAELKNPAHLPGEMRYFQGRDVALIAGEPRFDRGNVVYPVMVLGELIETYQLTKRRSRKTK